MSSTQVGGTEGEVAETIVAGERSLALDRLHCLVQSLQHLKPFVILPCILGLSWILSLLANVRISHSSVNIYFHVCTCPTLPPGCIEMSRRWSSSFTQTKNVLSEIWPSSYFTLSKDLRFLLKVVSQIHSSSLTRFEAKILGKNSIISLPTHLCCGRCLFPQASICTRWRLAGIYRLPWTGSGPRWAGNSYSMFRKQFFHIDQLFVEVDIMVFQSLIIWWKIEKIGNLLCDATSYSLLGKQRAQLIIFVSAIFKQLTLFWSSFVIPKIRFLILWQIRL